MQRAAPAFDLDGGVFYRLAIGKRCDEQAPAAGSNSPRLLAHMRRWARLGAGGFFHFVELARRSLILAPLKTGFARAARCRSPIKINLAIWRSGNLIALGVRWISRVLRHSPAFLVLRHTRSVTRRRPGSYNAAFQFAEAASGSLACRRKWLDRLMDTIHPDYLRNADQHSIGTKPDTLVVSLEEAKKRRAERQKA